MEDKSPLPLWVSNFFVFGLLFLAVVAYFLWQIQQTKKAFFEHVNTHSQLVARVIQLNTGASFISQEVVGEILHTFLSNTASFVDYLDSIEPFVREELTAYAHETGLEGISIVGANNRYTEGPFRWSEGLQLDCNAEPKLKHDEERHLYLYVWPRLKSSGCVTVGMDARKIESLQEQLALGHLTEALSKLPGMNFVEVRTGKSIDKPSGNKAKVNLREINGVHVAEAKLFYGDTELVLGLDASYLVSSIDRLWRNFFAFIAFLVVLWAFLSLALYRRQLSHLTQVRTYERRLSREREDGTLGRAAASIAHEIRNPLNALGMGLQRLKLEARELNPEHQNLVSIMLDAVQRTNSIVSGLLKYTRPNSPKKKPLRFDLLVRNTVDLYMPRLEESNIEITSHINFDETVSGDPGLLGQVVENLLKNALEAQSHGGFIFLELTKKNEEIVFKLRNGGFFLPVGEIGHIFDPYFTTKTDGTGLGLPIAQRIVQAHGGRIDAQILEADIIELDVYLPLNQDINRISSDG